MILAQISCIAAFDASRLGWSSPQRDYRLAVYSYHFKVSTLHRPAIIRTDLKKLSARKQQV